MEAPRLFPIFLKLAGQTVLLVGAGPIAVQKVETLLSSGVLIRVIAPEACEAMQALLKDNPQQLSWQQRKVQLPEDIEGAVLVISATNDNAVNQAVVEAAREQRLWANAVDVPELCAFYTASTVDTGPVRIAISSEGQYPGLVAALRKVLEILLPQRDGEDLQALADVRQRIKTVVSDPAKRSLALKRIVKRLRKVYWGL